MFFKNNENLIECIKSIYDEKYDLSEIFYIDDYIPIKLKCDKHGDFFDSPMHFISSRKGCPKCWDYQSSGEKKVREILEEYGFVFEQEKTFPDLIYKMPLYFDFYIPDYNTVIEFQGPQHFKPIEHFGGIRAFEDQKKRDQLKRDWCDFHKVELIEINFYEEILPQLKILIDLKVDTEHF